MRKPFAVYIDYSGSISQKEVDAFAEEIKKLTRRNSMNEVVITRDLMRLCVLMNAKNEIQDKRHYSRQRKYRYNAALTFKSLMSKHKRAKTAANIDIDKKMKELPKWVGTKLYWDAKQQLQQDKERGQTELNQYPDPNERVWTQKVSKKLKKEKTNDLYIEYYKAQIGEMQARMDKRLYTKEHRKEIATILKRNKWYCHFESGGSGRYISVLSGVDSSTLVRGREQIAQIAAMALIDQEITNG